MTRRLLRFGAEALKPHFEDGAWRRPLVSKRVAARLRKEAIANGTFGSFDSAKGGWDPAWDACSTAKVLRPPKLHKRERDRESRFKKITDAMAGMDSKVEQHRQNMRDLKPKPGIETLYKKLTSAK